MSIQRTDITNAGINGYIRLMTQMCKADFFFIQGFAELPNERVFDLSMNQINAWLHHLTQIGHDINNSLDTLHAQIVLLMAKRRLQEWTTVTEYPRIDRNNFIEPFTAQDQRKIIELQRIYFTQSRGDFARVLKRDFEAIREQDAESSELFHRWLVPDIHIIREMGVFNDYLIQGIRTTSEELLHLLYPESLEEMQRAPLNIRHRLPAHRSNSMTEPWYCSFCLSDHPENYPRYKCSSGCGQSFCLEEMDEWDRVKFNNKKPLTCPLCRKVHPRSSEPI